MDPADTDNDTDTEEVPSFTVRDAISALRASRPEHAANFEAIHVNLASYKGLSQALVEFLRLIITEPKAWLRGVPSRWRARRATKARASFLFLSGMDDVNEALAAEGRPEVLDELKTVFAEKLTVSAIEAKYAGYDSDDCGLAVAEAEPQTLQYTRLRSTCLAMLRVTGRDDLSEVFGALWEANEERKDEDASLYQLMDRIINRSVTLRDVRDLVGGKIG